MIRYSVAKETDASNDDDDVIARSNSDLHDAGSAKMLVDEIQYNVDGLNNQNSSKSVKLSCLKEIFRKVTASRLTLMLLRSNGIANDMLRLLGILEREREYDLCIHIIALIHVILFSNCNSHKLNVPSKLELPNITFCAIIAAICVEPKDNRIVLNSSSVSKSNFHKRRKFAKSEVSVDNILPVSANIDKSTLVLPIICEEFSSASTSSAGAAGVSTNPSCLSTHTWKALLRGLFEPAGSSTSGQFIRCNGGMEPSAEEEVGGRIAGLGDGCSHVPMMFALYLMNRFLYNKVQQIASEDVQSYSELPEMTEDGMDSINPNTDVTDIQVELKYLSNYQRLLRWNNGQIYHTLFKFIQEDGSVCFAGNNSVNVAPHGMPAWRMNRIYLSIGILEAACFRCFENEYMLSRILVSQGNEQVHTATVLFHVLQSITDSVTNTISLLKGNTAVDVTASSPSPFKLFHELNPLNAAVDDAVTVVDIWFAIVRSLINMSHVTLSRTRLIPNSNCSALVQAGCIDWCVKYLHQCITWRAIDINTCNAGLSTALSPNESVYDRNLFDSTVFVLTLLANLVPLMHSHTHPPGGITDVCTVLVELLVLECGSFMSTLEDTDAALSKTKSKRIDHESSEGVPIASEEPTADAALPVAEIIVCGHISLALYKLCTDGANPKERLDDASEQLVTGQLPHKSWWLPIRVLKGFLALQSKSGILMADTLCPVIEAIQVLEARDSVTEVQDAHLNSIPPVGIVSSNPVSIDSVSGIQSNHYSCSSGTSTSGSTGMSSAQFHAITEGAAKSQHHKPVSTYKLMNSMIRASSTSTIGEDGARMEQEEAIPTTCIYVPPSTHLQEEMLQGGNVSVISEDAQEVPSYTPPQEYVPKISAAITYHGFQDTAVRAKSQASGGVFLKQYKVTPAAAAVPSTPKLHTCTNMSYSSPATISPASSLGGEHTDRAPLEATGKYPGSRVSRPAVSTPVSTPTSHSSAASSSYSTPPSATSSTQSHGISQPRPSSWLGKRKTSQSVLEPKYPASGVKDRDSCCSHPPDTRNNQGSHSAGYTGKTGGMKVKASDPFAFD